MKGLEQISLRQLRALEAVAATANISAAADVLGLTGPAVHSQLKLLEETLGSPLLVREGRQRNVPTAQGDALLTAYGEIRAALERACATIDALNAGKAGNVVLGFVSTAKYFAPRIVALLLKEMPELRVSLRIANREATIAALARGEFDLCIMGRPPREPLVEAVPLVDHPHIIVAAREHPLANGPIDPELLLAQRFVLREPGSGTRILAIRFLDELGGGRELETIEMSSNETIKQAVLSGLGIALLSAHTVAEELASGRLVALPISGTPITRKWYVLSLLHAPLSASALRVRQWLVDRSHAYFPRLNLATPGRITTVEPDQASPTRPIDPPRISPQ